MEQEHEPKSKLLAIYARVSTDEQREGQTIDSQLSELESFAHEQSWQVVGIYKDEGWSGAVMARPALDRLRDDAQNGKFAAVLINDVDRLARDVAHLGVIKRDLERHGVRVIFRKLPGETSPTYNLMVNILGSFAEFERELIADRTRRGRRYKVEVKQQFLGSIAPYGYRYVLQDRAAGREGYLELHPEEAPAVRQMFLWVAREGLSAHRVVTRLNQLGIRPRRGNAKWAKSTVLRILHTETYMGTWHYNKFQSVEPEGGTERSRYHRHKKHLLRLRSRGEWLPVRLPEHLWLVSPADWQRVQEQIARNVVLSPRRIKRFYLLRGLIRCGGCGFAYVGDPLHDVRYYRCSKRCKQFGMIRAERLDATVWQAVAQLMQRPEIIAEGVARRRAAARQQLATQPQAEQEARTALGQISIEEERILEAYRSAIITAAQLSEELGKLKQRRTIIEARLQNGQVSVASGTDEETPRSIASYCRRAAARMGEFSPEEQQRFLRLLHLEVIFTRNLVRIKGRLPSGAAGKDSSSTEPPQDGEDSGTELSEAYLHGRSPISGIEFTAVAAVPRPTFEQAVNGSGQFCRRTDPAKLRIRRWSGSSRHCAK